MSCSTDNAIKQAPLERVPAEIKIHIIGYVADLKSLRNLMLSSRAFKETVKTNEGAIAKEIMAGLIGPDLYKLALMAEVSSYIDITDRTAVKEFLDTYVRHEEWPSNVYSIRQAAKLEKVHNDLCLAMIYLDSHYYIKPWLTDAELSRLYRILYICQIAGNLFRWNFGGDGEVYFQPLFPDLSQAFWKQVPAWDAARLEIIASDEFWSSAFIALKTTASGPLYQLWAMYCPNCGEEAGDDEYEARRISLFLSSGLAAITGYKCTRLWTGVREMYTSGCRGNRARGVHDVDPESTRVFYDTCHATIVEPLPQTSPFYEQDPGMKELFCSIRRHLPTLDAVDALLEKRVPEYGFWRVAIADKTCLGIDLSQMSLEQVPELWRQYRNQYYDEE
ncbi:hypothetical protein F4678DRAFT_478710 [Xylaria arbuscula]|nr:hypothetical protein F4678DRAFT_478710 [Xylaria arbuscula]